MPAAMQIEIQIPDDLARVRLSEGVQARLDTLLDKQDGGHSIVRKDSDYRQLEFSRRKPVDLAGVATWITSREDLILSKLVWARDANSDLQKRDVQSLLDESVDWTYLKQWAPKLGVGAMLEEIEK